MIITQKCIPYCNGIEISNDSTDITDKFGNLVKRIYTNSSVTTNIEFHGVVDNEKIVEIHQITEK